MTQIFEIHRDVDITGLSGTGIVADGAVFPDGTTVVRWREVTGENYDKGVRATTVVHPNVESVEALHGHGGATRLVFTDDRGAARILPEDGIMFPGEVKVREGEASCSCGAPDAYSLKANEVLVHNPDACYIKHVNDPQAQGDPLLDSSALFKAGRSLNGDPSMYPVTEDPA